jgi:hypothetical protein
MISTLTRRVAAVGGAPGIAVPAGAGACAAHPAPILRAI